jgi:hypothetical protein
MALLPGYKGLGGTAKRVQNIATGEILSRRQYAEKVKRQNITNETFAKIHKEINPLEAYARPAKGRKSLIKAKPKVKAARATKIKKKIEIAKLNKVESSFDKKIKALRKKQHHIPKVTGRLLKAGHYGRRFSINDYDDLVSIIKDAQKSKIVFAYSWGIYGMDTRPPHSVLTPTLSDMMTDINQIINEDEYDQIIEDFLDNHLYLDFIHPWIFLAFNKPYGDKKAAAAGLKKKQYIGKHQR